MGFNSFNILLVVGGVVVFVIDGLLVVGNCGGFISPVVDGGN